MPKFIKTNTIINVNRHGVETDKQVLFTTEEVVERVINNPSLVIEVTESHASQVIRPQQKYQELSDDVLARIEAGPVEEEKVDVKVNIKDVPKKKVAGETKGGTLKFNGA